MVILYMIFLLPLTIDAYHLAGYGQYCSDPSTRIRTREDCQAAAAALGLSWGNGWWGPNDFAGCLYTRDSRMKVYFNYSPHASNNPSIKPDYAEICTGAEVNQDLEDFKHNGLLHFDFTFENAKSSNLELLQSSNSKCGTWTWLKCYVEVYDAVKLCYQECIGQHDSCFLDCASFVLKAWEKCLPCIQKGCCAMGYTSCCNATVTYPKGCIPKTTYRYKLTDINDFTKFKLSQLKCPTYYAINELQFMNHLGSKPSDTRYWYNYVCCRVDNAENLFTLETAATSLNPTTKSVQDFTNQDISCATASNTGLIQGFAMLSEPTAGTMWYTMACVTVAVSPTCIGRSSLKKAASPHYYFWNLRSISIRCPTVSGNTYPHLQQFQLKIAGGDIFYDYTCCE